MRGSKCTSQTTGLPGNGAAAHPPDRARARGFGGGGVRARGVARGGGRRFAHPYLLTHHVQDGLLPLKQNVRRLLEPRTTFLVRRFTARVGDGLPALRSFVAGPDTGLTDANAAPRWMVWVGSHMTNWREPVAFHRPEDGRHPPG